MINDILDLSKIEAGKMELHIEEFKLSDILKQIEATAKPLVEKNKNKFVIDDKTKGLSLTNDQTKLRQILFNMLSNAAKFTKNGKITLSVETVNKMNIKFDIIDTGIGMNKEQLENVFEEFTQAESSTSKDYGGTGLGLPISKKMAEMMGGEINAKSSKGKGTTFTVTLPITVSSKD